MGPTFSKDAALAWVKACTSVDTLRCCLATVGARREDLRAAKGKEAPQTLRPHVLPQGGPGGGGGSNVAEDVNPNELFPALRVSQDQGFVDEFHAALLERLDSLSTSKMGPQAARQAEPYAQPSYETGHGGGRAMPLTGPGPAGVFGSDVFALAEANERREEAQKRDMRGPGPDPERVSVGPVPEEKAGQSQEIAKETGEQAAEKTRAAAGATPQGQPQPTAPPPAQPPQAAPVQQTQPAPPQGPPPAAPQTPHEQAVAARAPAEMVPTGDPPAGSAPPPVAGKGGGNPGTQARKGSPP